MKGLRKVLEGYLSYSSLFIINPSIHFKKDDKDSMISSVPSSELEDEVSVRVRFFPGLHGVFLRYSLSDCFDDRA